MSPTAATSVAVTNNPNVTTVPPTFRVHHRATPPNSNGSKKHQQEAVKSSKPSSISGCESIIRFLSLPRQAGVVLLLEFLNSFRILGLRFVLFNYVTNEYGISDTYAGKLLGIKGMVDVIFGLVGSILVDLIGVRRVSIVALTVAIVGRSLLAFGRTNSTLIVALLFFSPCGEAMLSMGLYRVALKKLTTPLTRPLAFAVSYAASNLSGALADVVVDRMRSWVKDLEIDRNLLGIGGVYTPIRQFIVVTWIVLLVTFVIAFCFLRDETVVDADDPDPSIQLSNPSVPRSDGLEDESCDDDYRENGPIAVPHSTMPHDAIPARPMVSPRMLKRIFPNQFPVVHSPEDEEANRDQGKLSNHRKVRRLSALPNYKVYKTPSSYESNNHGSTTTACYIGNPLNGIVHVINQIIKIVAIINTWQVMVFGVSCCTIAMQWTASEVVLPPFLERRYGEHIAIYSIQSINLFGGLILPPIVGAFTTGTEDFQIVMPGLWIMACSPIFLALFPNVFGACMWQIAMTIGEVLWSPRQDSWTAGLAPSGMEGLFFAIGSARSLLGPLGDMAMGFLNEKYNTNCPDCRDQYGHFCQYLSVDNDVFQCVSLQESCDLFLNISDNEAPTCPKTCLECPTWEATNPSTFWYMLIAFSMSSPLAVWFFLPFLRGHHAPNDGCYGIFKLSIKRILGILGAVDDNEITSYEYIDESEMRETHAGDDIFPGKE